VKGAQPHEVGTATAQLDVAAHDIDDVDARQQVLQEAGRDHPESSPHPRGCRVRGRWWAATAGPHQGKHALVVAHPLCHLFRRHGRGDAGALADVAAQIQQHSRLGRRLDAFGHHRAAEGAGQADHAFDDGAVLRVVEHVVHETAIDLQHVDRQPLQVGQRGVAGAEVVEREAHAQALAAGQQGRGGLDVGMGRGFEHLEFQVGDSGLAWRASSSRQAQREVRLLQVSRRDVDADRDVEAVAPPLRQVLQRLREHPVADARRQAGVLDQRQELQRRDQALRGCSQRSSASKPSTWPLRMSTLGW
jgi:hypothetical protein